ncbi:MAG TPA: hypothetical protein QGF35_03865 [Dehalococcoidia bacterium]|nr:hypothetical protein [Dehalococcoidia bacterium]
MRLAILLAALIVFSLLVILAVVFRSSTARDLLRLMRRLAYAWVILMVVVAIFEFRRRGL